MNIVKRDGQIVKFDESKIKIAVNKASNQIMSGQVIADEVLDKITKKIKNNMTVEEIQDIVVKTLMGTKYKDVAMAYQSYRVLREDMRNKESKIYKNVASIVDAVDDDILNENANKDSKSLSVQRDLLAGVTSKDYYLNKVIPKHLAQAHLQGRIHLHDLDYLTQKYTNCENLHLERMLKGGCKIGNAEMSEPNGIDVAIGHTIQIIASVSSNTFGGCTVPYFDRDLVPYVRKTFIKHLKNGLRYIEGMTGTLEMDKELFFKKDWLDIYDDFEQKFPKAFLYAMDLTKDSVRQAIQGFEYEINSLSTVNGQTPFTTIGIGTETSFEGRLIQSEVFKQRKGGFGKNKNRVVVFPKIVFAVCDEVNFNEDSPNFDIMLLGAECMTKSVYPDILFVSKEEVDTETVTYPMGE